MQHTTARLRAVAFTAAGALALAGAVGAAPSYAKTRLRRRGPRRPCHRARDHRHREPSGPGGKDDKGNILRFNNPVFNSGQQDPGRPRRGFLHASQVQARDLGVPVDDVPQGRPDHRAGPVLRHQQQRAVDHRRDREVRRRPRPDEAARPATGARSTTSSSSCSRPVAGARCGSGGTPSSPPGELAVDRRQPIAYFAARRTRQSIGASRLPLRRQPVGADAGVDRQRWVELVGAGHLARRRSPRPARPRRPGPRTAARRGSAARAGCSARLGQRRVAADHRHLHDVGGRALDHHVDREPLALLAHVPAAGAQLGHLAAAPEQGRDVAVLGALGDRLLDEPGDRGEAPPGSAG